MKNILVEVSPINKTTGLPVTVRMSRVGVGSAGSTLDDEEWSPIVIEGPQTSVRFFGDGSPSSVEISHGNLGFLCSKSYKSNEWSDLVFDNAQGRIWYGEVGQPFSSYVQIYEGSFGPLRRLNDNAQVALLGSEAELTRNLLSQTYAGTGGIEGQVGLKGSLKPWLSGFCQNIEPVLLDQSINLYQVHGYGPVDQISVVYENALSLGSAVTNTNTYAQLAALDLADGTWATCHALGLFRLANQPSGKITADVSGAKNGASVPTTIGDIAKHLITTAGVDVSKIDDDSFDEFDHAWCYFTREQTSVGDVVRKAFFDAAGYLLTNGVGKFIAGRWPDDDASPTILNRNGSTRPLVSALEQLQTASQFWKVRVGHDRCWSTHSASEISPAITAEDDEARQAAEAARQAAEDAQAAADAAMLRLNNIASDSVLERAEKGQLLREVSAINAGYSSLNSTGTALGLTSQVTAHSNAKDALDAYLSGLSPAWNNLSVDTPVVAATFKSKFDDYYAARQALMNAASNIAALAGYLTNESHTVVADDAGNLLAGELAKATGTFNVLHGLVDVTTNATFTVVSQVGCVASISPTGVYSISSMSGELGATASFKATYANREIVKVFTISKAKGGASAKTLILTSNSQIFTYNNLGVANPASQTVNFYAERQNTTAAVTWKVYDGLGVEKTPTSNFLTISGQSATMNLTQFANARGTTSGVRVSAFVTDGVTISDTISVVKVQDGTNGSDGLDGQDAKAISLTSTHQTFTYASGATTPNAQTTTFVLNRSNVTAAAVWKLWKADGTTAVTLNSSYITTSGNTATVTHTQFQAFCNAQSTTGMVVGVEVEGLTDKISVVQVKDGAQGPKGDTGNTGGTGPAGPAGRAAIQYHQTGTPTGMIAGDTWYNPATKAWQRYSGSAWQPLLGGVAALDIITANNIAVDSISAISGNFGQFITTNASGSTTMNGALTIVKNASNVEVGRWGIW